MVPEIFNDDAIVVEELNNVDPEILTLDWKVVAPLIIAVAEIFKLEFNDTSLLNKVLEETKRVELMETSFVK